MFLVFFRRAGSSSLVQYTNFTQIKRKCHTPTPSILHHRLPLQHGHCVDNLFSFDQCATFAVLLIKQIKNNIVSVIGQQSTINNWINIYSIILRIL
jgi:hypothetical protein